MITSFQTPPQTAGVSAEQRCQLQNHSGRDHRPAGGAGTGYRQGKHLFLSFFYLFIFLVTHSFGFKVFFLVLFTYFMPLICAAVRGGGKWESVSVSEKLGHGRQQTPSKERQEETALHLQRGAALHWGTTLGCSRHAVCSKSHTYTLVWYIYRVLH